MHWPNQREAVFASATYFSTLLNPNYQKKNNKIGPIFFANSANGFPSALL